MEGHLIVESLTQLSHQEPHRLGQLMRTLSRTATTPWMVTRQRMTLPRHELLHSQPGRPTPSCPWAVSYFRRRKATGRPSRRPCRAAWMRCKRHPRPTSCSHYFPSRAARTLDRDGRKMRQLGQRRKDYRGQLLSSPQHQRLPLPFTSRGCPEVVVPRASPLQTCNPRVVPHPIGMLHLSTSHP